MDGYEVIRNGRVLHRPMSPGALWKALAAAAAALALHGAPRTALADAGVGQALFEPTPGASCPATFKPGRSAVAWNGADFLAVAELGAWAMTPQQGGLVTGADATGGTATLQLDALGAPATITIDKPGWHCSYRSTTVPLGPPSAAPAGIDLLTLRDASRARELGAQALNRNDPGQALHHFEQAWQGYTKVFGPEDLATLELEIELAWAAAAHREFDTAATRATHAVAIAEQRLGTQHPLTLWARTSSANAQMSTGNLAKGLQLAEETLAAQTARFGQRDPARVRTLILVVRALWSLEQPAKARGPGEEVLSLARSLFGVNAFESLQAQYMLTGILLEVGELGAGLDLIEDLHEGLQRIRGPDAEQTQNARNILALYYQEFGRLDDALRLQQANLESMRRSLPADSQDITRQLMSLGWTQRLAGRWQEAHELMREAWDRFRAANGPDHTTTLTTQASLGAIEAEMGHFDDGLAHLRDAQERHRARYGDDNAATVWVDNELGEAYVRAGRAPLGIEGLQRALSQRTRLLGEGSTDTIQTLATLAAAHDAAGNPSLALEHSQRTVAAVEALRRRGPLSKETRQALLERWIDAYKRLAWLQAEAHDKAAALRTSELAKARTLLESLALQSASAGSQLDAASAEALSARTREIAEIDERLSETTADAQVRALLESQRNQALATMETLKGALMQRYPKFAQLTEVRIVDAQRGRSLLPLDAVFVSFVVSRDHVLALSLTRRQGLATHDLGSGASLEAAVAAYRALLFAESDDGVWRLPQPESGYRVAADAPAAGATKVTDPQEIGRWLAARLLQPLRKTLAAHRSWIVSSDGALAVLPFAALPWRGSTVVARHDLSFIPSLSVLALVQERARQGLASRQRDGAMLAVGAASYQPPRADPDAVAVSSAPRAARATPRPLRRDPMSAGLALARFAQADHSARGVAGAAYDRMAFMWPDLSGSLDEVRGTAALFRRKRLLVGDEASEERLRELDASGELAHFRYLHFATHGYLNTEVPALSAVVLAQYPRTTRFDGYITAAEWPTFNLRSDLAVLSACETGLGRVVQGEGVIGLPYALFVAGNRDAVLTLARVPDRDTAAFVVAFFRRVAAGTPHAQALGATQREFQAPARARRASGFPIWAAFQLHGSPDH